MKKYQVGTRVMLTDLREAIILDNNLKSSDYLIVYKKLDNTWSQTNITEQQISGPWKSLSKITFNASIVDVDRSSITIELNSIDQYNYIFENLLKRPVNVTLTERIN